MVTLVTGGTGFIGFNLVERLLAGHRPEDLVCLVKSSSKPSEVAALARIRAAGIRVIEGDLNDPKVSRESVPAADIVFHLAANIDTDVPEEELRVNDQGTEHLLNWLQPVSPGARVMYTSSVAVHDRAGPARGPLCETSPYIPRTAYGVTKLRGERLLIARAAADGFTYTILRLPTVYGPGAKPGGLFDLLFDLTAAQRLTSRIDWPGRTSIMHVRDVAQVLVGLAARPEAANQAYCLAHPYAPTVGELARHIGRASGHPVRPVRLPEWTWSAVRTLTWLPLVKAMVPKSHELAFWRLTLIIDHGFWFETSKFQSVWKAPLIDLDAGLAMSGQRGRVSPRPTPDH